jgi:Tfp pilus assembly protein PilN
VKAVNLIPSDTPRARSVSTKLAPRSPALIPLALLAIALVLVTVYVLTENSISDRRVKLAATQNELSAVKAQAARLTQYAQFQQLAQARIQTIRQIATSRFDWDSALSNLSKVVPANTSLQSLLGTVSPDASVNGSAGGVPTSQSLRAAIDAPAFSMTGCTKSHDDVARLISRLRLIDGVTRVTLADSQKSEAALSAASVAASGPSSGGCAANWPTFDLIVFFRPLPGATSTTGAGSSTSVATSAAAATSATTTSTPGSTATTTSPQTTTTATSQQSTPAPGAAR